MNARDLFAMIRDGEVNRIYVVVTLVRNHELYLQITDHDAQKLLSAFMDNEKIAYNIDNFGDLYLG